MNMTLKPRNGRWDLPCEALGLEEALVCVRRRGDGIEATGELFLLRLGDGGARPLGVVAQAGALAFTEGAYYLFYIAPEGPDGGASLRLRRGVSLPLDTAGERVLLADGASPWTEAWRDPQLVRDGDGWLILCGALRRGCDGRRGCVARFRSGDLVNWRELAPIETESGHVVAPGAPCFFSLGDWEYLTFTALSDRVGTRYRLRRRGEERWSRPENDGLDGRAFLFGRALRAGGETLLCGVLPTRDCDPWNYRPEQYMGRDYRSWDQGGALAFHRLSAAPDGALRLSPAVAYPCEWPLTWRALNGDWRIDGASLCAASPHGAAHALSEQPLPERFELAMRLSPEPGCRRLGLALFADETFAEAYYLYFEPDWRRAQLRTPFRMTEEGSWAFPQEVELETRYAPGPDGALDIRLLRDGDAAQLWVNGAALSFRAEDRTYGRLGLSVSHGSARWHGVRLSIPEADA